MLRIEGDSITLRVIAGARVFRPGREPEEFEPGASLDFLLAE